MRELPSARGGPTEPKTILIISALALSNSNSTGASFNRTNCASILGKGLNKYIPSRLRGGYLCEQLVVALQLCRSGVHILDNSLEELV
jgi:hypothetical protein